ncbi:MAG TPA: sigma-54 dependent transcriptional regulator [Nitrospiraceae bacterium]|nr:sigma-54 dependent transcriptional regulator [Nitrospiraceae bacterium]
MRPPLLLIIEDEERMRRLFELVLSPEGYDLRLARSGELGLQFLADTPAPDLIITDLQLGSGMTGMQVLESAKASYPDIPVLIVTGYGTVKSAVEAMQKGAYDYISKPIDNDELKIVVARAIELRRLSQTQRVMYRDLENEYGFDRMISLSPRMAQLKALARDIAKTDATVLVTGESGTGKELLARAIHLAGPRSGGPLVAVNCAGIPEHLLESELFGYEKGAFTDAKRSKPGRFQLADRGTLFLDEIGEMSLTAQAALLRVLETRLVEPLGSVRGVTVDIRVVAATNQSLPDLVKQGRFREDLYYRLNVCHLHIPPLRERPEDIRPLLDAFLERSRRESGTRLRRISPEALARLEQYEWPGNVRELRNLVEWLTITCKRDEAGLEDLPPAWTGRAPAAVQADQPPASLLAFGLSADEMEKRLLQEALDKSRGNISEAARLLKMTRNTLRYRMAKYQLS